MSRSALFPSFVVVGFVGTRKVEDPAQPGREARLHARLAEVIDRLRQEIGTDRSLIAVSALATGSDTIFAEVVAERGINHQVFLPQTADAFFNLPDFGTEAALERSRRLAGGANVIEVQVASDSQERQMRFTECGYEVANSCDVLIAVHAASAIKRPGGTIETLEFARTLGKRVITVPLEDHLAISETGDLGPLGVDPDAPQLDRLFTIKDPGAAGAQDHLPAVTELKRHASAISQRAKSYFQYSAGVAVTTHVLATVIAVAVLVYDYHHLWAIAIKVLLLAVGLTLPIYLHLRTPQHEWATARLVAELCRSVLALRGFPNRLSYLKALHLPELSRFVQALEVLHLKAAARQPFDLPAFAKAYEANRINAQMAFYAQRARQAKKVRRALEWSFYVTSSAALISSIVYLYYGGSENAQQLPTAVLNLTRFCPIAFPVIAAACASLISTLDLDHRIDRFDSMVRFLTAQRGCLRTANSRITIVRIVNRVEQALLQEVVEWFAKHVYARGH